MGSERSANPAQIRAPLFIGYIKVSAVNSGLQKRRVLDSSFPSLQ